MKYLIEREEFTKYKIDVETEALVLQISDYLKGKWNLEKQPSFNLIISFLIKNYLKSQ